MTMVAQGVKRRNGGFQEPAMYASVGRVSILPSSSDLFVLTQFLFSLQFVVSVLLGVFDLAKNFRLNELVRRQCPDAW